VSYAKFYTITAMYYVMEVIWNKHASKCVEQILNWFNYASYYKYASRNNGDTFWEMRQAISSLRERVRTQT
jgi:hypothetical protein